MSPEAFTPMPKSGILEFDFFGCQQPTPFDKAISDHKFCNVLANLYVITCEEEHEDVGITLNQYQSEILFHPDIQVQVGAHVMSHLKGPLCLFSRQLGYK